MPASSSRCPSSSIPAAVRREFSRLAKQLAKHDRARAEGRRERGLRQLAETVGLEGAQVLAKLVAFSPDLTRFVVDFAYGDVIGRQELDARTRALVVVAALAAMGNAQPQLQVHIGSALNSGCTREEIIETLLVVAVYAGFPAAMNGMVAARAAMETEARAKKSTGRTKKSTRRGRVSRTK